MIDDKINIDGIFLLPRFPTHPVIRCIMLCTGPFFFSCFLFFFFFGIWAGFVVLRYMYCIILLWFLLARLFFFLAEGKVEWVITGYR